MTMGAPLGPHRLMTRANVLTRGLSKRLVLLSCFLVLRCLVRIVRCVILRVPPRNLTELLVSATVRWCRCLTRLVNDWHMGRLRCARRWVTCWLTVARILLIAMGLLIRPWLTLRLSLFRAIRVCTVLTVLGLMIILLRLALAMATLATRLRINVRAPVFNWRYSSVPDILAGPIVLHIRVSYPQLFRWVLMILRGPRNLNRAAMVAKLVVNVL